MSTARLKHFGWGREGEGRRMTAEEESSRSSRATASASASTARRTRAAAAWRHRAAAAARHAARDAGGMLLDRNIYERAAHAYGKSCLDTMRRLAGDYASAPDVVAYPRNEAEVAAVMDWAARRAR